MKSSFFQDYAQYFWSNSVPLLMLVWVSVTETVCRVWALTVDLQHVSGPGALVELVDVLRDHHQRASLSAETRLTLGDGSVSGAGRGVQGQLSAVLVELPDAAGVTRETLRRGQILPRHTESITVRTSARAVPQILLLSKYIKNHHSDLCSCLTQIHYSHGASRHVTTVAAFYRFYHFKWAACQNNGSGLRVVHGKSSNNLI